MIREKIHNRCIVAPLPKQASLRRLPRLESSARHLSFRFLVSSDDFAGEVPDMIVETLGYGVGQSAEETGLRIVPSREMLQKPVQVEVAFESGRGVVDDHWCFLDVCFERDALDLDSLGFSGLTTLLAGDVFGRPYAKRGLVLWDVDLSSLGREFPGPQIGAHGVLRSCGRKSPGALLGLLMKPDMGVAPRYYADLAEAAALGGADYIKEDELTLDSAICPRFKRVEAVASRLSVRGLAPLYAANATSRSNEIESVASRLVDAGASALLINALHVGLDAVASVALWPRPNVPIHVHRAGYDLLTSGPRSIAPACLTKLFRSSGADIVHVGSPLGGAFPDEEVSANVLALLEPMGQMAASLPVIARSSMDVVDLVRDDYSDVPLMVLADAQVYESPRGIEAGVAAIRSQLDSCSATNSYAPEE